MGGLLSPSSALTSGAWSWAGCAAAQPLASSLGFLWTVDSIDSPKVPQRIQVAIVNGYLVMGRLMDAVHGLLPRACRCRRRPPATLGAKPGLVCRTRAALLAITHSFSSLSASSKRHMARARR